MRKNIIYYSNTEEQYPKRLDCEYRKPEGIYVIGSLPDPDKPTVAMVGARKCSSYGKQQAEHYAATLAEYGVQVISGLAYGIDKYSHQGAISGNGRTFAVMGCGADICYPRANQYIYQKILETGGGILSEFPPGTPPRQWHFPQRNRLISALADLVLIVEARARSGSLITADFALEQGKTVMAVPGRVDDAVSEGCNRLIAQGAGIAWSVKAVLDELEIKEKAGKNPEKEENPDFYKILMYLEEGEKTLQELLIFTGMSMGQLSGILLDLQLKGRIEEEPAQVYRKRG